MRCVTKHTQVILDKSSQKRKITPPSPPTVENMKYITQGRNGMKKEKTRRKRQEEEKGKGKPHSFDKFLRPETG